MKQNYNRIKSINSNPYTLGFGQKVGQFRPRRKPLSMPLKRIASFTINAFKLKRAVSSNISLEKYNWDSKNLEQAILRKHSESKSFSSLYSKWIQLSGTEKQKRVLNFSDDEEKSGNTQHNYRKNRGNKHTRRLHVPSLLKKNYSKINEFQGLILESMTEGVALISNDGQILWANTGLKVMFGYPEEKVVGMNIRELKAGTQVEREFLVRKILDHAQIHGSWSGEVLNTNGDGVIFPSILKLNRFRLANKIEFVAIHEDISKRKQDEARMKQLVAELTSSNEELKQLAYVASHDLQEPLRNVINCVQILDRKLPADLPEDISVFVKHAITAASRASFLVEDLLTYSKVGTVKWSVSRTDLNNTLQLALQDLETSISRSGAIIQIDKLPELFVEASQIRRLFQNLIGNSIKFCAGRTPQIAVSAEQTGQEWRFSVSDNGIGIEQSYLERIFLIFQRLHTKNEYPGTGIGLAISKKIVERHGGRIWAESQPGEGTKFIFTIPTLTNLSD